MHPVIRVATLVALAVGLAPAAPAALLLSSLLLTALTALANAGSLVFGALHRLRWLLVSVTLLYAWLLPGEPLFAGGGEWAPTWQGLLTGLCRSWMLLVMAVAARLLVERTRRDDLIAALYAMLKPLKRLNLHPERFCLRLVLTLEYALAERAPAVPSAASEGSLVSRATSLARRRLDEAERRAEAAPVAEVRVPRLGAPPMLQWAAPPALLAALLVVSRFS